MTNKIKLIIEILKIVGLTSVMGITFLFFILLFKNIYSISQEVGQSRYIIHSGNGENFCTASYDESNPNYVKISWGNTYKIIQKPYIIESGYYETGLIGCTKNN